MLEARPGVKYGITKAEGDGLLKFCNVLYTIAVYTKCPNRSSCFLLTSSLVDAQDHLKNKTILKI